MSNPAPDLRRTIGFWGGSALLVGTAIGSGIFRTPASIAAVVPDPRLILGLWLFFGVVSLCGALSLAELATMMPQTGGSYVYLRAAYGDCAAFVFGWLYLLVAIPSGVAATSVFLSEMLLSLTGSPAALGGWSAPDVAISAIAVFSIVNILGVRLGANLQAAFTLVKVAALLVLIGAAFLFGRGSPAHWWTPAAGPAPTGAFLSAAAAIMYTYNGWAYVSLVAGEIRDPQRRLVPIILAGTGFVALLYFTANLAYLYVIPLPEMPGTLVPQRLMTLIAGPIGGSFVSCCILASVVGGLNGIILMKARVAYAQARDGLSFAFLGRAHPTRATPHRSILIQGAIAALLVLALREPSRPTHLFDRLIAYFITVEWLALVFVILAVFVLRRTQPGAPRPYRTIGYPVVPLVFVAGTLLGLGAILWSSCSTGDWAPLIGLAIVFAGFPVYWLWRRVAPAPPS